MEQIMQVRGRIFNIQRFSVHDGPGVRTIVFLKGCPLRCRWCCNPEGQEWKNEIMTEGGTEKVTGREVTVGEVIAEVERDRVYYARSGGGGLTLSGGECTAQPDFAAALLQAAKERGISTAIETTGHAPRAVIERLLPYVDTVLMDIKHMDSDKHRAFCGQDNCLIRENAVYIAAHAAHLIIRTPVIPTFNASETEIQAIAAFAASLPGVREMHLLPYHRMGADKYTGLGRAYAMAHIDPPTGAEMERYLQVVSAQGLIGQIGG